MRSGLAAMALVLAGCGLTLDVDRADSSSGRDASVGPDAGGVLTDAGLVRCLARPTDAFPSLDACERDNDCAILVHARDACGSLSALGVHRAQVETFEELEALCRGMYPPCRTEAGPLCAERDGACGAGAVGVACVEGRCESFLEP